MPVRSMTGFGLAEARTPSGFYRVEIRGVNNRFFDLQLRLPRIFSNLEQNIKKETCRRPSNNWAPMKWSSAWPMRSKPPSALRWWRKTLNRAGGGRPAPGSYAPALGPPGRLNIGASRGRGGPGRPPWRGRHRENLPGLTFFLELGNREFAIGGRDPNHFFSK